MTGFDTWEDVLAFIARGGWLWYHAPLDLRPTSVRVVRVYKNGKIRLDPGAWRGDACAFTADRGHLSRMRRQSERG